MATELTAEWVNVISMMQRESPMLPHYQPITIYPNDPPEMIKRFTQWNTTVSRWDMARTTMLVGRKGVYSPSSNINPNRNGHPFWAIPPIDGKVLDLGCNIGSFGFSGLLYAKAENRMFHYIGVDNDDLCVDFAACLRDARRLNCKEFIFCHGDVATTCQGFCPQRNFFDVVIFLSIYHHIFGLQGANEARRLLNTISNLAPVMYFETATRAEPCNPDREYWWNALPMAENYNQWVKDEVICYSEYNAVKEVGVSHVGRRHTRILYRFTRDTESVHRPD